MPAVCRVPLRARIRAILGGEDGQAMVEYGAMAAGLLIGMAVAIKGMQMALSRSLEQQYQALSSAP